MNTDKLRLKRQALSRAAREADSLEREADQLEALSERLENNRANCTLTAQTGDGYVQLTRDRSALAVEGIIAAFEAEAKKLRERADAELAPYLNATPGDVHPD